MGFEPAIVRTISGIIQRVPDHSAIRLLSCQTNWLRFPLNSLATPYVSYHFLVSYYFINTGVPPILTLLSLLPILIVSYFFQI